MVFSSIIFIFYFMPVFFILYWLSPLKNTFILIGSLIFYAWSDPGNLGVLLPFILVTWLFGIAIGNAQGGTRRILLGVGVAVDLSFMIFFKYLDFLIGQVNDIGGLLHWPAIHPLQIALPLGISFFVFQGISYLIDIYRRDVEPQRNLLAFAAYKALFPQLIAGPIVRYRQIARKLTRRRTSLFRLHTGVAMFIVGLAQKTLVANIVAMPADNIFAASPLSLSATAAWFGALCYTLQIYFDFAGYSNMAIGMGHMMGFTFPANFNLPYASRSVTEFWRRWHMTLSSWFRDYVYIPLGGNRRGAARTYLNLIAVFLLCGFWHGAAWTFAAWGLWHGLFLMIERMGFAGFLHRFPRVIHHVYTMLVVMFGWVLFRADTIGDAARYVAAMFGLGSGNEITFPIEQHATPIVLTAGLIGMVCAVTQSPRRRTVRRRLAPWTGGPVIAGAVTDLMLSALLLALLFCSVATLAAGSFNPFIYFRF